MNHTPTPDISTLSYTTLFRSRLPTEPSIPAKNSKYCGAYLRKGQAQEVARPPSSTSKRAHEVYISLSRGDEEFGPRSEEHTSELQSHSDLVCRLLLEKKKKK